MNEMSHIRYLFTKLLDNSITQEELDVLLSHMADTETEGEIKSLMESHWEEIEEKLDPLQPTGLNAQKRFANIARRTGLARRAERVEKGNRAMTLRRIGEWAAIAASVLVLVFAGWYWLASPAGQTEIVQGEPEIARSFHGKQIVNLPDGSTVILNEESRLSYRENFGVENREVLFAGEGYFDIQHDPERPFIVHTGQLSTTVLGTAFNLIAYDDQSEFKVAVERGEVAVADEKKIYDHILPEEQLVLNTRTMKSEKAKVDLSRVLAWKDNFLILDDVTIGQATEMIGQKYAVNVRVENEKMKACMINAAFLHGETLDQVLRVLCGVLQAEYTIEDQKVNIKGGRACV